MNQEKIKESVNDRLWESADVYDENIYYYDLQSDIANLGSLRDTLEVGETFTHNDQTFEIIEREEFNQCFVIQKVKDEV